MLNVEALTRLLTQRGRTPPLMFDPVTLAQRITASGLAEALAAMGAPSTATAAAMAQLATAPPTESHAFDSTFERRMIESSHEARLARCLSITVPANPFPASDPWPTSSIC